MVKEIKMKQTEIGLIPEDWEYVNAEKYINFLTGFPFKSDLFSANGIKLLRGSNVKRNYIDWSPEITQYWKESNSKLKGYELEENDVVISMDGSLVGRSFGQISKNDLPSLLVQRVARIRGKNASTNYLKHIYCSDFFTNHCDNNKTASAIPHISPKDIKEYKITIPKSLVEQETIAAALSDCDAWIDSIEQVLAKKCLIKQGAMQELLTPKDDWEVKKLGEVIDIYRGGSPRPIQNYMTNKNDGINWIKIGDTSSTGKYIFEAKEKIIPEGENYSRRVFKGDFLLSNSMSFGRPYILKIDGCIHDGWLVLQNYQETFNTEFLYYLLLSKNVLDQYKSKAAGSGVLNLNKQLVGSVELIFPSHSEQTYIATILSDMDLEIEALEQKLNQARQIKQGMMQELLTGKTRLIVNN